MPTKILLSSIVHGLDQTKELLRGLGYQGFQLRRKSLLLIVTVSSYIAKYPLLYLWGRVNFIFLSYNLIFITKVNLWHLESMLVIYYLQHHKH